jgi:hypothetical protein
MKTAKRWIMLILLVLVSFGCSSCQYVPDKPYYRKVAKWVCEDIQCYFIVTEENVKENMKGDAYHPLSLLDGKIVIDGKEQECVVNRGLFGFYVMLKEDWELNEKLDIEEEQGKYIPDSERPDFLFGGLCDFGEEEIVMDVDPRYQEFVGKKRIVFICEKLEEDSVSCKKSDEK